MKKEFQFKRYSPKYKERVIDLLEGLWHFDREKRQEYFKWKYDDNPFTEAPCGFIALDGEKVVAFRGYMVQPMKIGDTVMLNAQLADTVTDSNYRRMGLFKSITRYSIDELNKDSRYGVSLNSSSGGPTLGGYLKLDWKPLSEREHLFRFSIKGIMGKLTGNVREFKEVKEEEGGKTYVLTRENQPKEMASMSYDYTRLTHNRTAEYYEWRLRNPNNQFVFAYLYENGTLQAFYVMVDMGGGRYDIIDFNGRSDKALKDLLDYFCSKESPLFVTLWTVGKNNPVYRHSGRFGFVSMNKVLRHIKSFQKPPFLVRKFHEYGADVFNENTWALNKIIADEI